MMVVNMKANLAMEWKPKEQSNGRTAPCTKEIGKITKCMGTAHTSGPMEPYKLLRKKYTGDWAHSQMQGKG